MPSTRSDGQKGLDSYIEAELKKKKGIWSVMLNISWTQCSFDSPNDEAKRAGMSRNELLFKSRDRV